VRLSALFHLGSRAFSFWKSVVVVLTLMLSCGVASAGMLTGSSSAISLAEVPVGETNGSQDGGVKLIVELLPASFLFSPDLEDFSAQS
jgi:hypothetical protein